MRYIQWRRILTIAHLHFHFKQCCSRSHRMYILSLQSHVSEESCKTFQWYANPSFRIIGHLLLGILQGNLACRPSILPMFCRPSANFLRISRANIHEWVALTFLHTPCWPLSFLGLGRFSIHYCLIAFSSHAWGAGIIPRVIVGTEDSFWGMW